MRQFLARIGTAMMCALVLLCALSASAASGFADPAFQQQWQMGEAITPNFWGPLNLARDGQQEPYNGATRTVQYFDKGRMEMTNGAVTNGLLTTELLTGKLQLGDATFEQHNPSGAVMAGDQENVDPASGVPAPTYSVISTVKALTQGTGAKVGSATAVGVQRFGGSPSTPALYAPRPYPEGANVAAANIGRYDDVTQHNVPTVLAAYRDRAGLSTIGYAIIEPFWSPVKVGGVTKQVLIQAFERRVLTYTPDNAHDYQVEMGNVGQHYYQWRYLTNNAATTPPVVGTPAMSANSSPVAQTAPATPQPAWHETGLQFGLRVEATCFDPATPGLFITSERQSDSTNAARMTYTNNYVTGQRSLVAMRGFDRCNAQTGSLFTLNADGATALRFSVHDPVEQMVDHFPDYIAPDGSVLYATGNAYYGEIKAAAPGHLFVSMDDGQTWQERGTQFNGAIAGVAPVDATAQSLYALVTTAAADGGQAAGGIPYAISFSADAGVTWEQRSTAVLKYSTFSHSSGGVSLFRIPGTATPPTTVGLAVHPPGTGPHVATDVQLSADGGRTFASMGSILYGSTGLDSDTNFAATSAGIIRITLGSDLALSTDGGATFTPLTTPVRIPDSHSGSPQIVVAPAAPNVVLFFIQGGASSDLYLSQDGGKSWARLAPNPGPIDFGPPLAFTPFNPPTLMAFTGHGLLSLALTAGGTGSPTSATASPAVAAPIFTSALAALTAKGSAATLGSIDETSIRVR